MYLRKEVNEKKETEMKKFISIIILVIVFVFAFAACSANQAAAPEQEPAAAATDESQPAVDTPQAGQDGPDLLAGLRGDDDEGFTGKAGDGTFVLDSDLMDLAD